MADSHLDFPSYFDWNTQAHPLLPQTCAIPRPTLAQLEHVTFDDEGPRDGVQGTTVFPGARDVQRYVQLAHDTGLREITVGIFSGEGSRAEQVTMSVLKHMAKHFADMTPIIIVRPLPIDLAYAKRCFEANPNIEVLIFQGSSSPRLWVQGWAREQVLDGIATAIDFVAAHAGGRSLSTLEDASRTDPQFVSDFLEMSVKHKAVRVVFADTTGHFDPWGAYRFIRFVKEKLDSLGTVGKKMKIDFHGHRDRYLDIPVALAAISAGTDRVHGVVFGIGERAGNTVLDALIYNVARMIEELGGKHSYVLAKLPELCRQYAVMTRESIPNHYPLVGENAFLTAVGIHADAQEKGLKLLDELESKGLSDAKRKEVEKILRTIYTSVDHEELGRILRYLIGPLSGDASIRMWLYSQGYDVVLGEDHPVVTKIRKFAKQQNRVLRDEEIIELLEREKIKRMRQAQPSRTRRLAPHP